MSKTIEPQRLAARDSVLGEGMPIRRLLPHRERRLIGAWCFFDHAGPIDVSQNEGMRVGPHPHTGLQTFSWMMDGEILHRDSLGYKQTLRKGEVNLMTAGRGITHSEESPAERSDTLQLAQLWIALPETDRFMAPAFEHYPDLPRLEKNGATITLLVGELFDQHSPVKVYSPLIGVDIITENQSAFTIPLQNDFEHGIAVLTGQAKVDGEVLEPGALWYFEPGKTELHLETTEASQIMLIGGTPFGEEIMMFWNFVARNKEEIQESTRLWNERGALFGEVVGYDGPPMEAPELR